MSSNIFVRNILSKTTSFISIKFSGSQAINVSRQFNTSIKLSNFTNRKSLNLINSNNVKIGNNDMLRYISASPSKGIQENISTLQLKKRPLRKRRSLEDDDNRNPGEFNVTAFATAEEYKLEELWQALKGQDLYDAKLIDNNSDTLHAVAKYQVGKEPREIFVFREGTIVLWNIPDLECSNILTFLRKFEQDRYSDNIVHAEAEVMTYMHQTLGKKSGLNSNGDILISLEDNVALDKYTFSNALSLSVKLGVWESSLDNYVDSIEFVTEDLKLGNQIKMTREDVLRKHGELFALRHVINLSSDLLDTPDFYWDREELEKLYSQICTYFAIGRRTRVMNEKLNHCVELIELLSTHLSDKHHVRLEWMIIILIMVEVGFECIHYADRFIA